MVISTVKYALWYLAGSIRSLSKFENTTRALISGKKMHPYFQKTLTFYSKKHPFFYQNTDIGRTGTPISTLDFIILCLFNGSRLGSLVISRVTRRQSRGYFVDGKGMFTPHTSYLGTKKYPSFTNRGHAEVLKKTHSSTKYVTQVPDSPPRVCPWSLCDDASRT